jgi:pilus assembly protein CpaB
MGAAIVLGLIAVYLANSFLLSSQRTQNMSGTTKVAVAAMPLNYGTDVTADKVRFVDFPNTSIPPGSFSSLSALLPQGKKRVALLSMMVNEPILASKISGAGRGASIASLLPDGKRAAAVRINDVSGVAGFIQPNDSVDVLVTRQGSGDRDAQVTDVLLQDARVIAIDQNAKKDNGAPAVAKTATLEVDPLDAQKLALAQEVGSLSLVLRKPGDQQNNPVVETVSLQDLRYNLYGGVHYPAQAKVGVYQTAAPVVVTRRPAPRAVRRSPTTARSAPRASTSNVQIVRGTQSNDYQVGNHGR